MMASIFSLGESSATPLILLLHVSTETECKAAVLAFEPHPRVIYSTGASRVSRPRSNKGNTDRTLSSVSSIIQEVLSYLARYGEGTAHRVSRVVCMLPTEHSTTRTKLVRSSRRDQFEVTASFAVSLLKEAEESRENEPRTGRSGGFRSSLLSRDILAVKVNGYDTANPFGKTGREVEVAVSETRGDEKTIAAIRSAVERHTSAPVIFKSASLAAFFAVRNGLSPAHDFLLLIGGAEATELLLVRRGSISDQLSFPLGSSSIFAELAENLGASLEGVSAALSLLWLGKLGGVEAKKLEKALAEKRPAWLLSFEKAVAELSEDSLLPPKLFILGRGNDGRLFSEFLRPGNFAGETLAAGRFETVILDLAALRAEVSLGTVRDIDLELFLEAAYLAMTPEAATGYPQFSSGAAVLQ